MCCDPLRDLLDDYVDGELAPHDIAAVEQHLTGCAVCRGEVADIRALIGQARSLSEHTAPEHWANVASRLAPPAIEPVHQLHHIQPRAWRLAAAAVVLMSLTSAATWWMTRAAPPSDTALVELRQAADELDAALRARGPLEPALQAVVDANLAIIDDAIRDTAEALEADPNSTHLRSNLTALHQRRIAVHRIAWERS